MTSTMADEANISKSFPTRPRRKPTSSHKPNSTPESKYWKSFKTQQIPNLVSGVTSVDFSPARPHLFAATHSASLSIFNPSSPTDRVAAINAFKDISYSASFRSDGKLIAAGGETGIVQVFETKTRNPLRQLRGHTRAVRLVRYPRVDRLHLFSGGDDSVVRYWDVASQTELNKFLGHKDYVRSGCASPIDDSVFATGSYDHKIRVWDVRTSSSSGSVLEINHEKPVESVVFLPSGGLIATAGGNTVKIWDLIGGGKCVHSMESHNKTVTSVCVGKVGKESGEESDQYRLMSVSLDGYLKVFDYSKMKITFSMRYLQPLMSIAFSPDSSTRAVGTSNGIIYVGQRKKGKKEEDDSALTVFGGFELQEQQKRPLRPSYFRYFHRGQGEKAKPGDFMVLKPKKVKLAEHDKYLRKFQHKEALVSVLKKKNPENSVAVMEELVARRNLIKCVSVMDKEELELLLVFLQKYCTSPRFSGFLMAFANKVLQIRAEEVRSSEKLMGQVRNLKRAMQEEIRIQEALMEIQGIISPIMRIAGR